MTNINEKLNSIANFWSCFVWNASWQSVLLVCAMSLFVWFGRRLPASLRYLILMVALLKFAVPPFWTFPTGMFSALPDSRQVRVMKEESSDALVGDFANAYGPSKLLSPPMAKASRPLHSSQNRELIPPKSNAAGEPELATQASLDEPLPTKPIPVAETETELDSDDRTVGATSAKNVLSAENHNQRLTIWAWLMLAHLVGALFLTFSIWVSLFRLSSLTGSASEVLDADLLRAHRDLCDRLGLRIVPRLLESKDIEIPISFGCIRPVVMLPVGLIENKPISLIAISHELVHHRRLDPWVNWLQNFLLVVWWFNPMIWILNRQIRQIREDCCDDLLLSENLTDSETYSQSLVEIAKLSSRQFSGALNTAFGMTGHPLTHRIHRIMDPTIRRKSRTSWLGILGFLLSCFVFLPGLRSGQATGEIHTSSSSKEALPPDKQTEFTETDQNNARPQETYLPTVRREVTTTWKVDGLVRTPFGLPEPNASYRVESGTTYQPMWRSRSQLTEAGKVNAFGQFEASVRESSFVVANAPGYAPSATGVSGGSYMEIELDKGRSISGRVKLPDGRPAENAVVRPVAFLVPLTKYQLSEYPASEIAIHPQIRYRSLGFPESGEPWSVKTDANGFFTLEKVPSKFRVAVAIELAGYQTQAIWVKTPNDDNTNLYSEFDLKPDGFETLLKPSFVLKLSGQNQATGGPEKISRIFVQASFLRAQDVRISNPNLYVIDFDAAVDVETSLQSMPDGVDIWVEPENDALMGVRFHLDRIGTEGELEKAVPFKPGKLLKGTVESIDGAPVPATNLEWNGPDQNRYSVDGDFPKFNVVTKQDGSFTIAVPESVGSLAIMGGVDGFRTVDSWSWINDPQFGDSTKEFIREISRESLSTGGPFNFRLEPADEVHLVAVRANGQPEKDAIISAFANRSISLNESEFSFRHQKTLATDADGKATLANWYSHAGWLAQARRMVKGEVQKDLRGLGSIASGGYPTVVEAFSRNGLLQGSAIIPLPEKGVREPIEVEIKLAESASILGRVIDQDGQPMGDLKVALSRNAGSNHFGSQIWETSTRVDGYFMATGLLPGSDYLIMLGDRNVRPLGAMLGRLRLDIKDRLLPGSTIEIKPIECFDARSLGGDLPELNIEGLGQSEAFEVIARYAQRQLAKVPPENPKFPSNSSADPIPVFIEKLAAILIPKLREVGNLKPGSDVELAGLIAISSLFLPPARSLNSSGEDRVHEFVTECLLVRFNQHPKAQPVLLAMAESFAIEDSTWPWKRLFDRSNYTPTKQKAGIETAMGLGREVGYHARNRYSADEFEAKFQELENHLKATEEMSAPFTIEHVDFLRGRVDKFRKEIFMNYEFNENNDVPEGHRYNLDRLKKLSDRMELFYDRIRE